jgi:hypothetical protein
MAGSEYVRKFEFNEHSKTNDSIPKGNGETHTWLCLELK